ncbi:hypothetical protein [Chitinophaga sp. OAE865]|uniref:Abi-alpha family protein n=1 Tax=Chitinophaga sp. OAE865 TaxID=2817898 RepID=UPI001AE1DF03
MNTEKDIKNFLKVVCAPADMEIEFMEIDNLRQWRATNVKKIIGKALDICDNNGITTNLSVHPKVALSIMSNASNEGEPEIQDLWAGLFVSSMSNNPIEENLIYSNLLKEITLHEARIIKFMCENCKVSFPNGNLPMTTGKSLYMKEFFQFTGECDITYLESLITHINGLRLNIIKWGHTNEIFRYSKSEDDYVIHLIPSVFCLNLYLKCNGFKGTISDYYKK